MVHTRFLSSLLCVLNYYCYLISMHLSIYKKPMHVDTYDLRDVPLLLAPLLYILHAAKSRLNCQIYFNFHPRLQNSQMYFKSSQFIWRMHKTNQIIPFYVILIQKYIVQVYSTDSNLLTQCIHPNIKKTIDHEFTSLSYHIQFISSIVSVYLLPPKLSQFFSQITVYH